MIGPLAALIICTAITVVALVLGFALWPRREGWAVLAWIAAAIAGILTIASIVWWVSDAAENRKTTRGRGDAPRPTLEQIDGRPADGVTEMPDGFPGVATKCVWDGWRAFVGTKGQGAGDIELVPDPDCTFIGTGPSR